MIRTNSFLGTVILEHAVIQPKSPQNYDAIIVRCLRDVLF